MTSISVAARSDPAIDERRNLTAFSFVGLWGLGGALLHLAPGSTAACLAGTFVIALAIVALQVVMHEAGHGLLARAPAVNRWAGVLAGAPGLLSLTAYRLIHARHHRQSLVVSAAESVLYGTPVSIVVVPWIAWRQARARERRQILEEYAIIGAGALAVTVVATPALVARFWGWPFAAALLISSVRGWTEFAAERLVRRWPAFAARPAVQKLARLVTDHLEHHLCPGLPWHRLPALRERLWQEYRQRGDGESYLEFLWRKVEGHEPPRAWSRAAVAR